MSKATLRKLRLRQANDDEGTALVCPVEAIVDFPAKASQEASAPDTGLDREFARLELRRSDAPPGLEFAETKLETDKGRQTDHNAETVFCLPKRKCKPATPQLLPAPQKGAEGSKTCEQFAARARQKNKKDKVQGGPSDKANRHSNPELKTRAAQTLQPIGDRRYKNHRYLFPKNLCAAFQLRRPDC